MRISDIINEEPSRADWKEIQAAGREYFEKNISANQAYQLFRDYGLDYTQAKQQLKLAKQGHPAGIGEKGLEGGGLNPVTIASMVGGAGLLRGGASLIGRRSAAAGAGAVAGKSVVTNLAKAKKLASKYPLFFNRKVLRRMDKLRTKEFKKKIAQLTKAEKFAMRDIERVKSLIAQATGMSASVRRQYIAAVTWLGAFIGYDLAEWSNDPNSTIGDLVTKISKTVAFEAGFILLVPIFKIVHMAARKPVQSLWNFIKSLWRKSKNIRNVISKAIGLSVAPAITGSKEQYYGDNKDLKPGQNESINEVFGLSGQKKKEASLAFGRLNPATVGHELMVNAIKQQPGDSFLFVSDRAAKLPTDPLSPIEKLDWARLSFDGIAVGLAKTVFLAVDRLYKLGYTDITIVEGEDKLFPLVERYNDVETKMHHYKFNSIKQVKLERDPDADDATGMSASKMRQAVIDNDFDLFQAGVTATAQPQAQEMFDKLRQKLGATDEN